MLVCVFGEWFNVKVIEVYPCVKRLGSALCILLVEVLSEASTPYRTTPHHVADERIIGVFVGPKVPVAGCFAFPLPHPIFPPQRCVNVRFRRLNEPNPNVTWVLGVNDQVGTLRSKIPPPTASLP